MRTLPRSLEKRADKIIKAAKRITPEQKRIRKEIKKETY